ncbi:H/ACA ribonucleoprotein complex subunit [Pimephales promelas]|nr:H/ACA ribonucleoprotein complex subunit [Pimephales promelas]
MLTRTPLSSKHGHYITSFLRQSVSRCSFTAVWQEAHVFPESTACSLIVQPGTFKGSLSCHSAGVVVEEGVVAVVLTEVVVVEVDSEGVVEVDSEGVVEVDSEGVEEVEVEVDLTDIKTLVHRNMLSLWESSCTPIRDFYFSVKLSENMKASSFKKLQKFYIDPMKLLPLQRFLPRPPGEKGPPRGGRGGGRGGRGGGFRGGRGGFGGRGGGRGGGGFRGGRGGGGGRGFRGGR